MGDDGAELRAAKEAFGVENGSACTPDSPAVFALAQPALALVLSLAAGLAAHCSLEYTKIVQVRNKPREGPGMKRCYQEFLLRFKLR